VFRAASFNSGRQATPFSIAKRTSSPEVLTPSFWRMIEEVLATVF